MSQSKVIVSSFKGAIKQSFDKETIQDFIFLRLFFKCDAQAVLCYKCALLLNKCILWKGVANSGCIGTLNLVLFLK